MKKVLFLTSVCCFGFFSFFNVSAQGTASGAVSSDSTQDQATPDTVSVGIYVTSIHDIDFRQKEYSANLWLWLRYKRPEFDFMRNLEVPMAKSFEKSYATADTLEDGSIYLLMKLECKMKGIWDIKDFPFDRQKVRFSIENSMYDARELIFVEDSRGPLWKIFPGILGERSL